MSQIKKMKALYYVNQGVFNIIQALILSFILGQFLVQMKTRKYASEIYWPLAKQTRQQALRVYYLNIYSVAVMARGVKKLYSSLFY